MAIALLASVMVGVLYHISMIGFAKEFGHLSSGQSIVFYSLFAILGLATVLSMPVTWVLGVALLVTSARKSRFALLCAVFTCLVSTGELSVLVVLLRRYSRHFPASVPVMVSAFPVLVEGA